jgi:hypothetical protein
MKSKSQHWTTRYIYNRIIQEINCRRNPSLPWLTRQSIQLLEQLLKPDDIGFEWGAGRSTLWLAECTKQLSSIESNHTWYEQTQQKLLSKALTNVQLEHHDISNLDRAQSGQTSRKQDEYLSYVQTITQYADNSFDYILIDGYIRDYCTVYGCTKLKSGGLLILDNANWFLPVPDWITTPSSRSQLNGPISHRWAEIEQEINTWRRIWTSDGVTCTLILFKPY